MSMGPCLGHASGKGEWDKNIWLWVEIVLGEPVGREWKPQWWQVEGRHWKAARDSGKTRRVNEKAVEGSGRQWEGSGWEWEAVGGNGKQWEENGKEKEGIGKQWEGSRRQRE